MAVKKDAYIVFGAKKNGEDAMRILQQKAKDAEFFFCDNYIKGNVNNIPILTFSQIRGLRESRKLHLFIAAGRYLEIYRQCAADGIPVDGIYDEERTTFYPYSEYCKVSRKGYENNAYISYCIEKENRVQKNEEEFLKGAPLSQCMTEVSIMLSNLCNYANMHAKCPASQEVEKQIMSKHQVQDIINQLISIDFSGEISFHIYNEPMIDPRLFMIARYVKEQLPNARTRIYTNGYYLNQMMCDELMDGIADILIVTGYGNKEYDRIINLNVGIPFALAYGNLDARMQQYEDRPFTTCEKKCRTFFSQVTIYVNGDLGLCCLDYRHSYKLGNVFESENGFLKCIDHPKIRRIQENLLQGNRTDFALCKNCSWSM